MINIHRVLNGNETDSESIGEATAKRLVELGIIRCVYPVRDVKHFKVYYYVKAD